MTYKKHTKKFNVVENLSKKEIEDLDKIDSELSYLDSMKSSNNQIDDQLNFADNYSEENDDELNGLYAHYNIVKKNLNASYRNLPEYKQYEIMGDTG